jgi:hypothetical protein
MKEGTSADAEAGPEVMDPSTQKMKDDADDETEIKDGVPGSAQDGADDLNPADKPAPANSSAALPKVAVITAPVTTNESTNSLEEQDDGTFYDGSDMIGEAQARYSDSYKFTHKPGDTESEKKLADLKAKTKGTGNRVVLQGRLGKNNPNAHKYSVKPGGGKSDGQSVSHSHQRIAKADAAHHDVYVYRKAKTPSRSVTTKENTESMNPKTIKSVGEAYVKMNEALKPHQSGENAVRAAHAASVVAKFHDTPAAHKIAADLHHIAKGEANTEEGEKEHEKMAAFHSSKSK